jgi:hypothetical protein
MVSVAATESAAIPKQQTALKRGAEEEINTKSPRARRKNAVRISSKNAVDGIATTVVKFTEIISPKEQKLYPWTALQ